MSLENAICFATGEPPGEEPSCVAELDLEYSTILSSAGWSSDLVRGEALLPLVIAQLGTTDTDRETWADQLVLGTVKRVLPLALDAVDMTDHAQACRSVETFDDAKKVLKAAENSLAAAKGTLASAYALSAVAAAATAVDDTDVASAASATVYCSNAVFHASGASARDALLREAVAVALDAYALTSNKEPSKESHKQSVALHDIRAHIEQLILSHKKARESGATMCDVSIVINQLTEILAMLDR